MDLSQVRAAVRRRWKALLVLFLLGPLVAFALFQTTPKQYRSTATVIFTLDGAETVREVVDGGAFVQDIVPSYSALATTPLVLNGVIDKLNLKTKPATLAKSLIVDTRAQSLLVNITAVDNQPNDAADLANEVAAQLSAQVHRLSAGTNSQTVPVLVTVVSAAKPANRPAAPNPTNYVLLGLLGGLALAGGYLYLREALSAPVRRREDVAAITESPVVGVVVRDSRSRNRPLVSDTHPHVPRAESFRMLRTNLFPRLEGVRLLVVTSPTSGDGRSSTVANLAVVLAHAGRRVLVIDADLRRPQQAELFGLAPGAGLVQVLNGEIQADAALHTWTPQIWQTHVVDVIPAGGPNDNASELLASPRMSTLLDSGAKNYDIVLVDTPALLEHTDAALVAGQADATLVVVDARRTESRELSESLQRLAMAGASVLGVVLNNANDGRTSDSMREPVERGRRRKGQYRDDEAQLVRSSQSVLVEPNWAPVQPPVKPRPRAVPQSVPQSVPMAGGRVEGSVEYSGAPALDTVPVSVGAIPVLRRPMSDAAVNTNSLELEQIRQQIANIRATAPRLEDSQRRRAQRTEPQEP